jgi:hypothetical protein
MKTQQFTLPKLLCLCIPNLIQICRRNKLVCLLNIPTFIRNLLAKLKRCARVKRTSLSTQNVKCSTKKLYNIWFQNSAQYCRFFVQFSKILLYIKHASLRPKKFCNKAHSSRFSLPDIVKVASLLIKYHLSERHLCNRLLTGLMFCWHCYSLVNASLFTMGKCVSTKYLLTKCLQTKCLLSVDQILFNQTYVNKMPVN